MDAEIEEADNQDIIDQEIISEEIHDDNINISSNFGVNEHNELENLDYDSKNNNEESVLNSNVIDLPSQELNHEDLISNQSCNDEEFEHFDVNSENIEKKVFDDELTLPEAENNVKITSSHGNFELSDDGEYNELSVTSQNLSSSTNNSASEALEHVSNSFEPDNEKEVLVEEDRPYLQPDSEEILQENSVEFVEEVQNEIQEIYDDNPSLDNSTIEFQEMHEENVETDLKEHDLVEFNSSEMQQTEEVEEDEPAEEEIFNSDHRVDVDLHQNFDVEENIDEADDNFTGHQSENIDTNEVIEEVAAEIATEDSDYEDAVEVEEEKHSEDNEDENIAQHESGSDNEQEEVQEDEKLAQVTDFDVRDSDDEANDNSETFPKEEEKPNQGSAAKILADSESEDEGEKEGDLIADIFGKSDDEDEEFTGFGEDESSASKKKLFSAVISDSEEDDDAEIVKKKVSTAGDESSSDEGVRDTGKSSGMVYDFDIMLQKKKEERRGGRRRRDGGTFISDSDDIIHAMLTKMKDAAEGDKEANRLKKPALNKMKMLPTVIRHLKKQDLKEAFVDMGVIAAISDWLTLLPDRSLPHISIRSELLSILHDLPPISPETLKSSGIGRAVMMMFKHPRETRKNKESAGRLISKWSRPIFGLNDNFKSMSRGEREQRDLEQMPQAKRRRLSSGKSGGESAEGGAHEPGQLRPGERGFIMRARVPKPSNKDYVIRPKWNVESNDDEGHSMIKRTKPRKDERLEKHLKSFAERKKNSKMQRAIGISIEGNKMPLS